ncbi:MAG: sulfatase [Candidatus Dormibacteraeota bacterium]|nr:sulfatase [Candidatus Dormibacteraeota bacterium]
MRHAVFVLFDTLNRRFLPPYGNPWVQAPNFRRLAERAVTFDTCYAGSMPCMPARRELHTGRYNLLHRGWGPLEPFDDSVPEMLTQAGVYTHLVSDHKHYWEDGGATYHTRYNSYEAFRGQEGDLWKGQVDDPEVPDDLKRVRNRHSYRQDWVNRKYLTDEADHPQTRTFDAGLEFLRTNHDASRPWFLQIETFDPHEPFFSYERYHELYPEKYGGPHFEWPDYARVIQTEDQIAHVRHRYAALLSMCDRSLGRLLDLMDELALWEDTLLVVGTDHGFLLGEHSWWGKGRPPWYEELIHTPLFLWDPRLGVRGERRQSLVQTIDVGPTLLEYFDVDATQDMQGRSLAPTIAEDRPVRRAGLFGNFGGHLNVTDGRFVYMRACATADNKPLAEYTLMPTHMVSRFSPRELHGATLAEPFSFTKGCPVLRVEAGPFLSASPGTLGSRLYDLARDPEQVSPLVDDEVELRMATLMVELMRESDAPSEQFQRLGLPVSGPVTREHLLVRTQRERVSDAEASLSPARFPGGEPGVHTRVRDLLEAEESREVLERHLRTPVQPAWADLTLLELAAIAVDLLPAPRLAAIASELARLARR